MSFGESILAASAARFEADRQAAYATLNLFLNAPVAVADHPNIVEETTGLIKKIADAEAGIAVINNAIKQMQTNQPSIESNEEK